MKLSTLTSRLRGEHGRFAGDIGFKLLTEICNAVFGLLTFAIMARLLVEKEDYAVVNQMIAISSLLSPILLVKMNDAFCVFLAGETDRERMKSRYFSVLLLCLPVCLTLCALTLLLNRGLSMLLFDSESYAGLMPLMALYFVVLALSLLNQSLYQSTEHQKKSNVFIILRCVLTTLSFFLLQLMPQMVSLHNVLRLYLLVESVVCLSSFLCIIWDFHGIRLRLHFAPLQEYYRYALPLMPYVVMNWVNNSIGRFMINHLKNMEDAATYGFYASLISRAFFVNAVLVYTIFPYVAKFWNQGNKEQVSRYLQKAFHFGVEFGLPATIGLCVTGPTLIRLMSGNNFDYAPTMMLWLCLGSLFQMLNVNFSYLIDLSRRTGLYNIILLIVSLLNVGLNLLLIPRLGIEGAAVALMLAYLTQLALTAWIGMRSAGLRVIPHPWQIGKALLASAALYAACRLVYADTLPRFALTVCVGVAVYGGFLFALSKVTKTPLL